MSSYTIVGAGAVGSIVGVGLAGAGHQVRFIEVNKAHVSAVRERGLRVSGAIEATIQPDIMLPGEAQGPLNTVLLAVKSPHTEAALAPLAPLLAADGFVVSLQNGLEEHKISRLVGPARTVGAFLTFGGHWRAPGEVTYGGPGTFRIGEIDGTMTSRVHALCADLAAVQPVEATSNIFGFLWGKMALGAIYFGTALTDSDVTALYAEPRWRQVLGRLAGEVTAVAAAKGVRIEPFDGFDARAFGLLGPLDPDGVDRAWRGQVEYWNRHAGKRTGIWRDLAVHKRRTEIDRLVGEVVAVAEPLGVPVPGVRRLVALVKEIEDGRRAQGIEALAELERALIR